MSLAKMFGGPEDGKVIEIPGGPPPPTIRFSIQKPAEWVDHEGRPVLDLRAGIVDYDLVGMVWAGSYIYNFRKGQ